MKYLINKLSISLMAITIFAAYSCKKNFEEINTPPEGASTATIPGVYNAIISSLPITSGEYSVMNSWLYQITQLGVGSSGYPFNNATTVWANYYQTLGNYRLLQDLISKSADTSLMKNVSAMGKTIMAYKTFKTTNYYGDMPYFQAGYAPLKEGDTTYYAAPYDKQSDIYASILDDLTWAVDNFTDDASQYSVGSYETFLQNDIDTWKKFANSLRLYIAITMHDKNSSVANGIIADALSKPLLEDGDDIGLWPSKIAGLQFQWRQWSFSANCYLRLGTTVWNLMSSSNDSSGSDIFDPRCEIFFESNGTGKWAANIQNPTSGNSSDGGAPYNVDNRTKDWSNKGTACVISPFNYYFEADLTSSSGNAYIPELMLTAAQVHFLKAEAYNRGLGVTANSDMAQTEYNAGIKSSINMWKGIAYSSSVWVVNKPSSATATESELNTMMSQDKIKYNTASSDAALKQIYAQLWLDFYRQPWDAWTLMRRTGNKTPMSTDNPQIYTSSYGDLLRFLYPDDDATYNRNNWLAETGGHDATSIKIWIMP